MTVPTQLSMNVNQAMHVMNMQTVTILMAATGVSAGEDSQEMDTTVQVMYNVDRHIMYIYLVGCC